MNIIYYNRCTSPFSPQHNDVFEHKNHMLERGDPTILFNVNLSKIFLGKSIITMNYLQNWTLTKALLDHKTPIEIWKAIKPYLSYLKVFACMTLAYIHKDC